MIPGSANPLLLKSAAAAGGYQISRSLRFNSSDSGFLSRTPASAGNRRTWTWAGWVKRSALGAAQEIFAGGAGGTDTTQFEIGFASSDILFCWGAATEYLNTTQVFRDVGAWYHIVVVFDTTQATANNRLKLYVNGTEVTTFSTNNRASLTQNGDFGVNQAALHTLGRRASAASWYLSGYLADIHFIGGSALDPTSFGETDANGIWQPKTYTGSYSGTNSFHLPFSDNSTAAALGTDTSGAGNTWTVNNISVTAGAGNDSLVDSPTNYGASDTGVGGEIRGNYCTLNPLDRMTDNPSNGNLEWNVASANHRGVRATIKFPTSGKWYYEARVGTASGTMAIGVGMATPSATPGYSNSGTWFIVTNSTITAVIRETSNSTISGMAAPQVGDILQVAYDADNGRAWFGKNNVWANGTTGTDGNPGAGTNPTVSGFSADHFPCVTAYQATLDCNFGQRPFAYTAPSGFKALCTQNLTPPTGVVAQPSTVMNVVTYSGTGSSLTLPNGSSTPTSISFTPDLIWIKGRSGATDHALYDAVRDVQKDLVSNSTAAETTQATGLTAFGTNTFTVGTLAKLNTSSSTYVAWCWDAGTTTVTNTQGSITSSVRANASAGFSVVTYTGTGGTGGTVGHGLGIAPGLIIIKDRDRSIVWVCYHSSLGSTKYLLLNTTDAATTDATYWGAGITSTTFGLQANNFSGINYLNDNFVAYCFAPVAGYSSSFSWNGTGSTDGPAIYLGFRPRMIVWKRTDSAANWSILDSSRSSYNVADDWLGPNSSSAEATDNAAYAIDFLSNGLKIRATHEATNQAGGTYVGFAWAESPFAYARAR